MQDRDGGLTYSKLRYLAASGGERWNRDANIAHLRVLANNDVVAYQFAPGGPRRVVYAAADGTILDDRATSMPSTLTADGDGLLAGFLDPTGVFLERRDPDGGVVWHVDFEGNGLPDLTVAPDGVIAALIRGPTRRIVRLDPATGQELSSVNVPGVERLGGANAQGAVGLGPIGSSSIGVARFTPAP